MNNKAILTYDNSTSHLMDALFETSPMCMMIVEQNLDILRANKAFTSFFGYPGENLKQLNLKDLMTEKISISSKYIRELFEVNTQVSIYQVYLKQNNEQKLAITHFRRLVNDNGLGKRFVLTFEPLESSKEREYQLAKDAMLAINEEIPTCTDEYVLDKLVCNISETLDIPYVLVGKYHEADDCIVAESFWLRDKFVKDFKYSLEFTPCEQVIKEGAKRVFRSNVQKAFPKDQDLIDLGVEGYIGVPLMDAEQKVIGHIVAMDTQPLEYTDLMESLLKLYSAKVTAELERVIQRNALKEMENNYRMLFDNGFDGIMIYDIFKGQMTAWNDKFLEYLGTTNEVAQNKHPTDYMPEYQPDGQNSIDVTTRYLKKILYSGRASYEFVHRKENGELIHTLNTAVRLPEPSSHLAVYIFRDITEQKKSEDAIKEKNIELQKYIDSNLQLENFAYVASHDMKEPLRNIGNFSQLLHRRYHDIIDEEGKEFINYIVKGVKNMNGLLDDLLAYSRVNSQEYHYEYANTNDMLVLILNDLRYAIEEREAEITVKNIPEMIYINKTMMLKVFQNLIVNAIKFTPYTTPKIIIDSHDSGDFWEFSVQDNGIGIAAEYHERIFILFKKLHNKIDYAGTGIGLSICKKIIEKHSGRIWVDSELGKGATFRFTIPKGK